jgi:hypothetical protein
MKHRKLPQIQPAVTAPQTASAPGQDPNENNYMPAPEEVARKAYFTYENEGSKPGHEVQHWLKAEADLIAERNLTRVHGYHNPT